MGSKSRDKKYKISDDELLNPNRFGEPTPDADRFDNATQFTLFNNPVLSEDLGYLSFKHSDTELNTGMFDPRWITVIDEDRVESLLQKIKDNLGESEQLEYNLICDDDIKKQYILGSSLEKQIEKTNELKSLSDTYELRISDLEATIETLQREIKDKNKQDEIYKTLRQQNKLLKQEISELKKTYQPILEILKGKLDEREKKEEQPENQSKEKKHGFYR